MWDIPVPSVTTLCYGCEYIGYLRVKLDLRTQLNVLIKEALIPFPNLVQLRVGDFVEWSRERGSSHWKPHLINLPLVRAFLLRGGIENVGDVDGCLRSALWPKDLTADVCTRLGFSFTENT